MPDRDAIAEIGRTADVEVALLSENQFVGLVGDVPISRAR